MVDQYQDLDPVGRAELRHHLLSIEIRTAAQDLPVGPEWRLATSHGSSLELHPVFPRNLV